MIAGVNELKRQAAERALEFVESGMLVGLGHGSTTLWAIRGLARRLKDGRLKDVQGVACSRRVEAEARLLDIPLVDLDTHPVIDLTIDGADEVDPQFNLIKGGGGALLREKIVAQASRREIIIVDESKLSPVLGTRWAVPVEILTFGWKSQVAFLESLGARVTVRRDDEGSHFKTDHGNYIADCRFGPIADLDGLSAKLAARAGLVEHGLFLGLATDLVVAGPEGVKHLSRN